MTLRLVLLLVSGVILVGVAVPTVAVSPGADDVRDGAVSLSLHGGPNGQYATVDDGELAIEMERLNDRAVTRADDVFTVTATADSDRRVWIDAEADGVEFYRSDGPRTPVESVVLSPGETMSVGLSVDTRESIDGDTFTVRVESGSNDGETPDDDGNSDGGSGESEPSIAVTDATIDRTSIHVGDSVVVTATVENTGGADGTAEVGLQVDGVVVAQRRVDVPAGETRTVTFDRAFDRAGEYDVAVDDHRAGRVVVSRPAEPAPEFEVRDATLSADRIDPGESVDVTATIANVGNASGTYTAELIVDGIVLETRTVDADAGEETTVAFTRRFSSEGVYSVAVNGVDAGDVTVGEPAEDASRPGQDTLPSAAVGTFGLTMLFGSLLVGRRRATELLRELR